MRAYGKKKTKSKLAGHQDCGLCHPSNKNKKTKARNLNKKEVKQGMNQVEETREEMIARWEKEGWLDPNCPGCEKFYQHSNRPCTMFAPPHKPNEGCESGKHPHCSCGICF